jgi:hypothetical protein
MHYPTAKDVKGNRNLCHHLYFILHYLYYVLILNFEGYFEDNFEDNFEDKEHIPSSFFPGFYDFVPFSLCCINGLNRLRHTGHEKEILKNAIKNKRI